MPTVPKQDRERRVTMDELTREEQEEIARHIIAEAREHCAKCQEFVCDWCVYREWRSDND